MAHFAKVEDGIVTAVIVAEQEFINSGAAGDPESWVQTSYNTRMGVHYGPNGLPSGQPHLRGNYAGYGYVYDSRLDAFYLPQPFASWSLNETTFTWEPPIPMPIDNNSYGWDEKNKTWKVIPSAVR
jgi:hypothetical protein